MRRLGWLALALAAWICSASSASALNTRCFEPLADFADRDPKNFSQVATPTTATPATGVKRFEVIGSGVGDANIDFLTITFSAPSGVAPADFFKILRQNFSVFAAGTTHQFAFGAYGATRDPSDQLLAANNAKWNENLPLGALMSFNLDSVGPLAGFFRAKPGPGRVMLFEAAGDVQATCASPTDLLFSTVETERGGMHPVAGNRGFGLVTSADGKTWTFYAEGVDRDSGTIWNTPFRGDDLSKGVFCKGQDFWIGFFSQIQLFLQKKQLRVIKKDLSNHGPVPYPFQAGQQPKLTKCSTDLAPPADAPPPQ